MTDAQSAQTALDKLIEAVEAGGDWGFRFWFEADDAIPEYDHRMLADSAYNGDLNAFNKLLNIMLPGWRARLDIGRRNRCWVISPDNQKTDAYGSNPARSGLLAILRAYRSMQP